MNNKEKGILQFQSPLLDFVVTMQIDFVLGSELSRKGMQRVSSQKSKFIVIFKMLEHNPFVCWNFHTHWKNPQVQIFLVDKICFPKCVLFVLTDLLSSLKVGIRSCSFLYPEHNAGHTTGAQ